MTTTQNRQNSAMSSVSEMLRIFDVEPDGPSGFVGVSDGGARQVVDGTQLLAQALVATAKTLPDKVVRSAHAVFSRAVDATAPVRFTVDVTHCGRSMASTVVAVEQAGRRCATVSVLADAPTEDLVRRHIPRPEVPGPTAALPANMPMIGRDLRIVGVADVNDPDEVGPPELHAWLHYDPVPERDDLGKALLAHFTGHLSVSTTLRAHPGIGTAQAHHILSTAVMTVSVRFHEPVEWAGWLLYTHESIQIGAGMSCVRGLVHTESGRLLASFTQEAMIRRPRADEAALPVPARL
ncbi:acyl-CoA thioesterase [Nocardia rhizosphaerihabitans]|uniref:acyl-CoA thioesterase n=1 Tax=Nocardia rhizosphaerihabitans TaxID=1691570 RepID=UPI00166EC1B8|nr:acyl-CoA thioesterase domain-containing protein [Nocardia rhizosphaerihabitans]